MLQDFIEQQYLIIEANVVTNVVVWNGDTTQWTPPQGSIALVQATTPAKVWVYDIVQKQWNLNEVMGAGSIGFTWDGTYCITNQPQPTNPQVSTTGTVTA